MAGPEIESVAEPRRAAVLLHPLRLEILRLAARPVSASELSPILKLSRQRIGYHVRQLAKAGFLRRAGRRRRRNMVEQRYVASAPGYLLSPELLGAVGADWRRVEDEASAGYLLALSARMQSDVARARREAEKSGRVLTAFSFKSQFRFEKPGQREAFLEALREGVLEVIERHTSPNLRADGTAAAGRPYRLVLGCYPYEG